MMRTAILQFSICALMFGQNSISRDQGRSMTISTGGIVATSQILASQAGAQILAAGGSAVDAAIAANAVLAVVEPNMNGIGGDLFAMFWNARDRKLEGLNASGWAPQELTIGTLRALKMESMPANGIHTVTVPGAAGGWWAAHKRFGKLPWKTLFQAAIHYAENGFPVTERIAALWSLPEYVQVLSKPEAAPAIFLPDGKPPKPGQLFRNPDLGRALRLVAEKGAETVYRGEIAQAILQTSKKTGGTMQAADLSEWEPEWVQPLSTTYRGWTVYELPPNGSGIGALEMLNIMEARDLSTWPAGSPESLHWRIEAMHLAYADLWHAVSDPRHVRVPVERLKSKDFARARADTIKLDRANCNAVPSDELTTSGNTTYLSVIDRDGNIVSWIQSIANAWGSGVNVDGMGFHLQNRGSYFRLDPAHANALAPRKRPFHTIIPAFMEKDGTYVGFGIMGGPSQPYSHGQLVSNIVDYGMNIQAAMDAPRFSPSRDNSCSIGMEMRVAEATRDALRQRGHELNDVGLYDMRTVGVGQVVMRDSRTGVNYGASDARSDGAAVPEPYRDRKLR